MNDIKAVSSITDKNGSPAGKVDSSSRANRLLDEKSPYLLQHAYNPVDWYPWGEEAFARARQEDRPIFLSIGYSTCHWCHVMEHESFVDKTVAAALNDRFIAIKVDREERPDIDTMYMTVCQLMTGRGGWPLTIIMTPDAKPFFAATYIPRESRYGMVGLIDLLTRVDQMWRTERSRILSSSDRIVDALQTSSQSAPGAETTIANDLLTKAREAFRANFDHRHGGFGPPPKFPTPHNLSFILQKGDRQIQDMVGRTLEAMRLGGIFDHIGFGFHRYSTDESWLVPHFEKMLYDQAMLIQAYLDMYLVSKDPFYAAVVREIATYVLRDMTAEDGGFYSAEDADSDGVEGKFYVWTTEELNALLPTDQAKLMKTIFNCRTGGNYHDEAGGDATGSNILHLSGRLPSLAEQSGLPVTELTDILDEIRERLFASREQRVHPLKDTKVLADWNGMMIAALARGSRILDEPSWLLAARRAFQFVIGKMSDQSGRLYHRYRDNHLLTMSYLDDYAFMAWGAIELYHSTLEPSFLKKAIGLADGMFDLFGDPEQGGFYQTARDGELLIVRSKDSYDGAIPSGNSVAFHVLDTLWRLTGRDDFAREAARMIAFFSHFVSRSPQNFTFFLSAFERTLEPGHEIVIVADARQNDTQEAIGQLQRLQSSIPNVMIMLKNVEDPDSLVSLAPFLRDYHQIDDKPTFFLCSGHACQLPTTDLPSVLRQMHITDVPHEDMT